MSETGRTEEELISEGEPIRGMPLWVRLVIGTLATIVVVSVVLMWRYAGEPTKYASPKELQLSNLLIFGLSILFVLLVPWERLGIRIRKIGSVEFDRVISGQAREHAEEFAELLARIEELEGKVRGMDESASVTESFTTQELRPLLLQFLNAYHPNAYSPVRINKWGARQAGFEKLANFSQGAIRKVLQDMVAEGKVATRVSRLGNTLYKIAD
jgi:hypothetical protein